MDLHKILKIVAGVLGLAGVLFLVMIISKGDEAIQAGDASVVDYMTYVAYITMGIIIFFVLIFVFKNLFSNAATLKKTLTNVGAFVLLFLIAYFVFAKGEAAELSDGRPFSEGGSKLVGAGLYLFYFLTLIASGLMLFTGVKRMLKK